MFTRDPRSAMRLRRISVFVFVLAIVAASARAAEPKAEPTRPSVRLVVDYGDGLQLHLPAIAWREGMTAVDTLTAMQKHPHGIPFVHRGSGAATMVTKIGDLKNEGDGKNWIFYLNEKRSEIGAGGVKLKPGDAVLWKFEAYDYNS